MIDLGLVSSRQLHEFLANQLNLPFIDLKHYNYKPEVVRLLPETAARRFRAIVLNADETQLLIGVADPTDIYAYDELSKILKQKISLAVVYESELLKALDTVYRRTQEIVTMPKNWGRSCLRVTLIWNSC